MKRRLFFWTKKHINSGAVKIMILSVPLVMVLVQQVKDGTFDWAGFFDTSILISFLFLAVCDVISKMILKNVAKVAEDSAKLDDSYDKLNEKYRCSNLIEYQNNIYPEECIWLRDKDEEIVVEDNPEKYYSLPKQIADNSKEIMEAHSESSIYNQINIRLDDVEIADNQVILHTSRTHFFDSLLTNRACDYVFGDRKMTIREIYEPGPFMKPLHLSKLSNHLGFNGFVLSSDKKTIPFILRGNNLSIAKNQWATSIGASLKTMYALDYTNKFKVTGKSLSDAVIGEIKSELRLSEDGAFNSQDVINSIFAVYRDFVECGKPQFLFCLQLKDITEKELRATITQKRSNKDTTTDGNKVRFFTIEQLKNAKYYIDRIEIDNIEYKMMPSSIVSVVLLLKHFEKKERKQTQ